MKTDDVAEPTESNNPHVRKKIFFVGILEVSGEKSRIRISKSSVRIRGSGSGSVSVADPKQKFRIRCRIRIRPEVSFGFGSGFESWIRNRIRILDSYLDQKLAKTSFFVLKYLPSLIFKHKKAAFSQLHDLASNKVCRIRIRIH